MDLIREISDTRLLLLVEISLINAVDDNITTQLAPCLLVQNPFAVHHLAAKGLFELRVAAN